MTKIYTATRGYGTNTHWPPQALSIDRPLRRTEDRAGKFEKKLDRRKLISFEVWEKGGWFGKDSVKGYATWQTGSPKPASGDLALLRTQCEVNATLQVKSGSLETQGEDVIGTLTVAAKIWRPLEFKGLTGKGDQVSASP